MEPRLEIDYGQNFSRLEGIGRDQLQAWRKNSATAQTKQIAWVMYLAKLKLLQKSVWTLPSPSAAPMEYTGEDPPTNVTPVSNQSAHAEPLASVLVFMQCMKWKGHGKLLKKPNDRGVDMMCTQPSNFECTGKRFYCWSIWKFGYVRLHTILQTVSRLPRVCSHICSSDKLTIGWGGNDHLMTMDLL